jgi:hypothetical protein
LERLGELTRAVGSFTDGQRPTHEAIGECLAVDEFTSCFSIQTWPKCSPIRRR